MGDLIRLAQAYHAAGFCGIILNAETVRADAKRLRSGHAARQLQGPPNPATDVDLLVDEIIRCSGDRA